MSEPPLPNQSLQHPRLPGTELSGYTSLMGHWPALLETAVTATPQTRLIEVTGFAAKYNTDTTRQNKDKKYDDNHYRNCREGGGRDRRSGYHGNSRI